jgi:NAD(P)-binding Rossmann-like domain
MNSNTNNKPIGIEYTLEGLVVTKSYDLMVVACDPRNLEGVYTFDPTESDIFSQLQNFTFHTTLMTVTVPQDMEPEHGVIFAPHLLERKQGYVYGFRNESAKTFGIEVANQMETNLVTVYQLLGPTSTPYTPKKFAEMLNDELPVLDWWPYGSQYQILQAVTTPYFDHFSSKNLAAKMPWAFLGIQGNHNTLYVHASTCFESVLDCWGYENMLLNNPSLPQDKSASIAIIGAGVSGLLFAVKLKGLGYKNIEILESTERYGGKTHTITMDGPYPPNSPLQPTYCELGTCYMSPAYAPMLQDLHKYLEGNKQIAFDNNVNRGIVTTDQLPPSFNAPLVMDNTQYILRKAEAELGLTPGCFDDGIAKLVLLDKLAKYTLLHYQYFPGDLFPAPFPMPYNPPQVFLDKYADKTFVEFLRDNDLQAIIGILQYGYEVQGYGTLDTIPAYYGLLWITPPIIEAMIEDGLGGTIPIVTAWSKGWEDVWRQIVEQEKFNITYNVTITSITRQN